MMEGSTSEIHRLTMLLFRTSPFLVWGVWVGLVPTRLTPNESHTFPPVCWVGEWERRGAIRRNGIRERRHRHHWPASRPVGIFFREIKTRLEWKVPQALRFASKIFGGGLFIPHPLLYFICSGAPVGTPKNPRLCFLEAVWWSSKGIHGAKKCQGVQNNPERSGTVGEWHLFSVRKINRFDLLNSKCISKFEGVFQTVSTKSALHLYAYNCVDFCGSQV